MLSRGLRITFPVGVVFVLFALGLHTVLRYYNAPANVEYGLFNVFAATFASTILTIFIGALLYDYQTERAEAGGKSNSGYYSSPSSTRFRKRWIARTR